MRESLWGGESPGAWLEGEGFEGALHVPRVMAGVLLGGGVFCSLKGHPGRVGPEWWLEEELSLDMMGSWGCQWKWPQEVAKQGTMLSFLPPQ